MAKPEVRYEDVRQGPTWTLKPDKAKQQIRVEVNFDGVTDRYRLREEDLRYEDLRYDVPKDVWERMLMRLK
ncbi:hypothetical protein LCGC14_2936800 [marine sediment metagenome]|uniref:Uncharacterized protein n=1 Tax=marine sediment metagenome TaxID=412755 RepID=A0A0F8XJT5_9ZZZZ